MDNKYVDELKLATRLAQKAGVIMLEYFDGQQQRKTKYDGTPVTIADTTINSMVIKELVKAYPKDGVVGEEESTADISQERLWFCDPIDGTKAFVSGSPTAMFSLGLVDGERPVMGVAYDPFMRRMYTGVIGKGSYCNGKLLHVNSELLDTGIIAINSDIESIVKSTPILLTRLIDKKVNMASFSGSVYKAVLIASGKLAGYFNNKLNPHDTAAIQVILNEAGGKISDLTGRPLDYRAGFRGALMSNSLVHEALLAMSRPSAN